MAVKKVTKTGHFFRESAQKTSKARTRRPPRLRPQTSRVTTIPPNTLAVKPGRTNFKTIEQVLSNFEVAPDR